MGRAEPESLRLLYQETCKSHATITDFRAKLLALLPLASGTGALLLRTSQTNTRYFGPIATDDIVGEVLITIWK